MKQKIIGNKSKTILKLIILTLFIFFIVKVFNPDSPKEFYKKHKSSLNKIIEDVDKSKGSHSKKTVIPGIKNIYYSSSDVYESEIVQINLKSKPFTPPFYIGLIYSYTGKARIPELPDGYLQEIRDGVWYYSDGTDNYFKMEHIEGNWFTFEYAL